MTWRRLTWLHVAMVHCPSGKDTGTKTVREVDMAHARAPAWLTASGLLGPCRLPAPKRQPTYKLKNARDGNAHVLRT